MSKKTLSDALVSHTTMRVRDADLMASRLLEALSDDIAKGGLKLPGIGSFVVKQRRARSGINPKTQRPYQSPERKVVQFKPSSRLVEKVNGLK